MAQDEPKIEIEKATDEPVMMPEADSIQVFDGFNTLGDDRYPPVRRPAVYPIIMAPDAPKQQS